MTYGWSCFRGKKQREKKKKIGEKGNWGGETNSRGKVAGRI